MSSPSLTDLLGEMRDLVAIEAGEISPLELASRVVLIGESNTPMAVPRGYMLDKIDPITAEETWEANLDDPEYLEWYSQFAPERPDPPVPEDHTTPEAAPPSSETPTGLFQAVRRRLSR